MGGGREAVRVADGKFICGVGTGCAGRGGVEKCASVVCIRVASGTVGNVRTGDRVCRWPGSLAVWVDGGGGEW